MVGRGGARGGWGGAGPFAEEHVSAVAIALSTLPLLDLRTFVIGASFLLGLLCYDFFWVFRSDVMMTVAAEEKGGNK